eukprot:1161469-Pelagomonas_calceolata.AAC.48
MPENLLWQLPVFAWARKPKCLLAEGPQGLRRDGLCNGLNVRQSRQEHGLQARRKHASQQVALTAWAFSFTRTKQDRGRARVQHKQKGASTLSNALPSVPHYEVQSHKHMRAEGTEAAGRAAKEGAGLAKDMHNRIMQK